MEGETIDLNVNMVRCGYCGWLMDKAKARFRSDISYCSDCVKIYDIRKHVLGARR